MNFKTGIYKHFKGNYYLALGLSINSETLEDMVIYQALYGDKKIWVRPLKMWNEVVEFKGKSIVRFSFVD